MLPVSAPMNTATRPMRLVTGRGPGRRATRLPATKASAITSR
jgi:hypothetical protein